MSCGIRGHESVTSRDQPKNPVADILLDSVTALAANGDVERACRLAGRAYVALRQTEPWTARRFDVLLHRLTRLTNW